MKRIRAGKLDVWATGGSDREGGGEGPAIVLCHGFGAPGDDLVSLHRVVDAGKNTRWFFPEAPLSLDFGMGQSGRAWWHIDMMRLQQMMMRGEQRALATETPDGLDSAAEALVGALESLATTHGLRRDKTILGGFSQGAMLSTEVALHADVPCAGLAVLSGALLSEERWREAARKTAPSIRAIVTHGRRDPVLPFAGAEALVAMLTESGATVEFVPHPGQHEIPQVALSALEKLAARVLGD